MSVEENEPEADAVASALSVENGSLTFVWTAEALPTLADLERLYILGVLDKCNGKKNEAVRILGIDRKTLYRKLIGWGEAARLSARRSSQGA